MRGSVLGHGRVSGPWQRRWCRAVLGLSLVALVPPLARAQTAAQDTAVVSWTSTGDDGMIGTAAGFDLRVSESPINGTNFDLALRVTGLPAPVASGTRQSVTVRGLTRGTTYYFALKVVDDAGNVSNLSNLARWDWVLDTAPPSAPHGVRGKKEKPGKVVVNWTAGSEPDLAGYTVYRAQQATGPFVKLTPVLITINEFTDIDLPPDAQSLWYEVTATDVTGNESARSETAPVDLIDQASDVQLEEAYPNPARGNTAVHIPVTLTSASTANAVFDILDSGGRRVRRFTLAGYSPGRTEVVWDGKNDAGTETAPGVYRGWLISGNSRHQIRLVRVP